MPYKKVDEENVVTSEMREQAHELFHAIIGPLEDARHDVAAMVLASLLGQNLAHVVRHSDIPLETLVDRATLAVRTNAQMELDNAHAEDDITSHHQH